MEEVLLYATPEEYMIGCLQLYISSHLEGREGDGRAKI
jgi:hypothetical protein